MTAEEILRLAQPFLSIRDAKEPTIRGADDLVAFARILIAEQEKQRWRAAYEALSETKYGIKPQRLANAQ